MRATQHRGKDDHSPPRLLSPRFGIVPHPMGQAEPCEACSRKGFPEGSPPATFHRGTRDPQGRRGSVRPGSARRLPKARARHEA